MTAKPSSSDNARQRGAYLSVRIQELKSELTALRAEKTIVVEKLRAAADRNSPEAKELKKRRVYLVARPVDVKLELDAALRERKGLTDALRA